MNSINPYAAPLSEAPPAVEAVRFAGRCTREDLLAGLRDNPPKSMFARIRGGMLFVLIFGMVWLMLQMAPAGDEPPPSLLWIMVAFVVLHPWLAMVRHFSSEHRRHRRRVDVILEHLVDTNGWLDQDHVVLKDARCAVRAEWSYFSQALVFPTHLLLPMTADQYNRLVIPFRFFSSAGEARQACQLAQQKVGLLVNKPPSDRQLTEMIAQSTGTAHVDVAASRQWNRNDWPIESDRQDQTDWNLDLSGGDPTCWFLLRSGLAISLITFWYFAPIWVAVAGWLIHDYSFFGSWSFLWERPGWTAMALGPTGFFLFYLLWMIVRSTIKLRHVTAQPLKIRIREQGGHLVNASCESWLSWSALAKLILEEKSAGWILADTGDEVRFPIGCFEDEATFVAFKEELSRCARAT